MRKYGENTVKELIGFIIDHHEGESLTLHPIDEESFMSIFRDIEIFVHTFAMNEEQLLPVGISIEMAIKPNRSYGFRISPFSNPHAMAAMEKHFS
jgi:hypothetical protein